MTGIGKLVKTMEADEFYMCAYKTTLNQGEDIFLNIDMKNELIYIMASIEIEPKHQRSLYYIYVYDIKTRKLQIAPLTIFTYGYRDAGVEMAIEEGEEVSAFLKEHEITREEIEGYRDHFLYDKVLRDWVEGNGERSLFTQEDHGDYETQDNTFLHLGEDWM
ncbi:MAG: TipC family immunity protein [Oscillospiraceae bacterium]|nr:TipC family immunity protein [Oscillospiraceae bacterium]